TEPVQRRAGAAPVQARRGREPDPAVPGPGWWSDQRVVAGRPGSINVSGGAGPPSPSCHPKQRDPGPMPIHFRRGSAAVLLLLTSAACGGLSETTLDGTVTYRERMALTPNATIRVALLDETVADRPTVIAETTFTSGTRQVPLAFSLPYNPGSIERGNTYSLLAEIRQDDHLLFMTNEQYQVINNDRTRDIELMLIRAQPGALTPDATGALSGRLFLSAEVLRFVP